MIKENKKIRRSRGAKIVFGIAFVVFAVYAILIYSMIGWGFLQSLKANREFWNDMVSLPKDWLFSNYIKAFKKLEYGGVSFFGMFLNSIWLSFGSTFLSVFMTCVTGYIFAKYKFCGREVAFSFILFTLTIPIVGSMPSAYRIITSLHLDNSPLYLLTSLGGFGGNFLMTYAFFKGINNAYSEAAEIDGAGDLYIFLHIMLPLAKALFFALMILGVIGSWNSYEAPILYLGNMPTLASGLYFYREIIAYESNEPVYLAGVLISTIPIFIMVAAFGNRIMENMVIGGVKG